MTRTQARTALAVAAFLLLAASGARAGAYDGSLWRERKDFFGNLKASQVGDIITVIISEETDAGAQARTKTEAASDQALSGDQGLGLFKFLDPMNATLKTKNNFEGKGETSRTGTLSARMSVTITEVLPNGNFRVAGTRDVVINQEKQRLTLTGVVRPEDIQASNTVLSLYLADARITCDGKGPVHGAQRRGLLTRLFSFFF
jgi:flagellar L-ring protein FlgH